MATKKTKTQAEKAVGKKTTQTKSTKSSANKKNTVAQKAAAEKKRIPIRVITSFSFLGAFVLFLVVFFIPEGAIITFIGDFFQGLMGKVGFIVSIPALLYLFLIHAFSGKRPVAMRTACIICFVLICGCIGHLALNPQGLTSGIGIVSDLYLGGLAGDTGGVVCGLLAILIRWLCGTVIAYIIFVVAAIFTLLGAMQITLPSIVHAIQNRPRAEWEDDEEEEKQDPATLVVNHIANKRIEHIENQRLRAEAVRIAKENEAKESEPDKVSDMMRQIDGDIETPVAASSGESRPNESEILTVAPAAEPIPETMPELIISEVPAAPAAVEASVAKEVPVVRKSRKVTPQEAEMSAAEVAAEIAEAEKAEKPAYCFPPINLLNHPGRSAADGTMEMRENSAYRQCDPRPQCYPL